MATFTFFLYFSIFISIHPTSSSSSPSPYLSPSTFPKNYNKMLTNFKIFIYTPPQNITFATPSPSLFYKFIINSQFLTREPEEAHFFLVLFSPETSTRSHARLIRELRNKYPYWNRTLGADHCYISPEGIDFSSDRNALELKKNSVQISVFPTVSGKFIPHKDISLPPVSKSSILLSHAPVKMDPLFLANYEYVSLPPVSKSSILLSHAPVKMDKFFLGYLKWDEKTEVELVNELRLDSDFVIESEPLDYVERVKSSKFCLLFYQAESAAFMTEVMAAGCVPVMIVDRPVQDFPLMDVLNWSEMALLVGNRRGAEGLKAVLRGVPEDKYERMKELCVAAAHHMVWNAEPQPYDAFYMVIYQLWTRRHTIRYTRREDL